MNVCLVAIARRLTTNLASVSALIAVSVFLPVAAAWGQSSDQRQPAASAFAPAPGQIFFLDLDTAPGAFSQWRHEALGTLNGLTAVLSVLRIRNDRKWAPTFAVYLESDNDPNMPDELGLQILTRDRSLPLKMQIVGRLHGKSIQEIPLKTTLALNENLKVEMRWAAPQLITVVVGGDETRTVRVSWPICKAVIIASTGELKVDPVVFGMSTQ